MSDFDGFLTETQREYLLGEHTPPSDNADQQMRYKIRERAKKGLEDIDILAFGLPEEDIDQIVSDSKADFEWEAWEKAHGVVNEEKSHLNNLQGVLTFVYLATLSDSPKPLFQVFLERAIKRAYHRRDQPITFDDIDVSIDVDPGPKAENVNIDDLSDLSQEELTAVVNAGELDPERLIEAGEEKVGHLGFTQEMLEQMEERLNTDE